MDSSVARPMDVSSGEPKGDEGIARSPRHPSSDKTPLIVQDEQEEASLARKICHSLDSDSVHRYISGQFDVKFLNT